METNEKLKSNEVIIFSFKITKRQLWVLRILLTISAIAGVALFFMKHS